MAWSVLYCPFVVSGSAGLDGQAVPTVITFAAVFDEDGTPIVDDNGDAIQIQGSTPLVYTVRQPSDYWDALQGDLESQLAELPTYPGSGTVYTRIDLPTS